MPLDSGCVGERPSRPASKNAKDKSNSAALLASRARARTHQEADGRESQCSSEKDSGYSDTGSDSLQTDVEDQQSVYQQKLHKAPGVQAVSDKGKHQPVSAPPELTPIFIIKNVVLKQPVQSGQEHVLQAPLGWCSGGANPQTPTHLLLLQQPSLSVSPRHVLKPQSQKKSKSTFLPILNSYPRIAPQPSKKTPEKPLASRDSNAEEHSLSKRVCTEEKREEVSTSTETSAHKLSEGHLQHHPLCHHDALLPAHQRSRPRPPCSLSTLSLGSPSVSSSETVSSACESSTPQPSPLSSSYLQHHSSGSGPNFNTTPAGATLPVSAKHRRFLNTVEILSQSGLLDITLRTQELLRQSTTTERDLAQLRQHTQLLCQAAQSGSSMPTVWAQLHQAMAQSGCYPSLKGLILETGVFGQPVADSSFAKPSTPSSYISGINRAEEIAALSPLFAPMCSPPAVQGSGANSPGYSRGYRGSTSLPDEILMPPDSSTHGGLL